MEEKCGEGASPITPRGDYSHCVEINAMSKNRKLIDEMMSGNNAMRQQREGASPVHPANEAVLLAKAAGLMVGLNQKRTEHGHIHSRAGSCPAVVY